MLVVLLEAMCMGILGCCLVMLWPARADQVVVAFCVLIYLSGGGSPALATAQKP